MKFLENILAQHKKNIILRTMLRIKMTLQNIISNEPITGGGQSIVCLTSYGWRLKVVHLTIESIANGYTRPKRLILWVAKDDLHLTTDKPLRRLQARGLEIKPCPDFKSHKKYLPYIQSTEIADLTTPLVTADDDTFYPRDWLRKLEVERSTNPSTILCYRAKRLSVSDGKITNYEKWPACKSTSASVLNVATGVSGILYPTELQMALKDKGTLGFELCPTADDIWLHAVASDNGIPTKQVSPQAVHFVESVSTSRDSLHKMNVKQGGNDRQILMAYSEKAIQRFKAEE